MKINNTSMTKLIIISCFILLFPFIAKSQKSSIMDEKYSFDNFIGITSGVGLVSYTGSFLLFSGEVDCNPYNFKTNNKLQTNFLFGLKAELKISKHFDIFASLLYEDRSAKFDILDCPLYVYVSEERPFELANFKQDLNAKINVFSISPMLKYRPFDCDVGILVGPSFAFMISDKLDSKEWITQPTELVYKESAKKERTIYSGNIEPKNSLFIDLKFGLSYGFMLTKQIKLSPEIFYVLPLTKVSSEDDWKISSIQFLVSCSYGF